MISQAKRPPRRDLHDVKDSQPWTAARCHRLLLQLESRLATLRRITSETSNHDKKCERHGKRRVGDENDVDKQSPKRVRYTYGCRYPAQALRTGNVSRVPLEPPRRVLSTVKRMQPSAGDKSKHFPTPMGCRSRNLMKTVNDGFNKSPLIEQNASPADVAGDLLGALRCVRRLVTEQQFRQYKAIFDWLASLLQATNTTTTQLHKKSLLGMCVRKVPACVGAIAAWEAASSGGIGPSKQLLSSISLQMYEELEGFGNIGLSWSPLKLTVRSHSFLLLKQAIRDGHMTHEYVDVLVQLCLSRGCMEEAKALASAVSGPFGAPRDARSSLVEIRRLRPLHSLVVVAPRRGLNLVAVFDYVSALIKMKQLPTTWLLTEEFSAILSSAFAVLATHRASMSAINFLGVVIGSLLSLNLGVDSWVRLANQRFMGIVAGITAAAIGMNSTSEQRADDSARLAWRKLYQVLEVSTGRPSRQGQREMVFVLSLARFLAAANNRAGDTRLYEITKKGLEAAQLQGNEQRHQAMLLVCSVSQGCSQILKTAAYISLAEVCRQLRLLAWANSFSDQFLTESAFLLAQRTEDLRDLAFAESQSQEKSLDMPTDTGVDTDSSNKLKQALASGWRWEEGINEWVLLATTTTTNVDEAVSTTKGKGCSPDLALGLASGSTGRRRGKIKLRQQGQGVDSESDLASSYFVAGPGSPTAKVGRFAGSSTGARLRPARKALRRAKCLAAAGGSYQASKQISGGEERSSDMRQLSSRIAATGGVGTDDTAGTADTLQAPQSLTTPALLEVSVATKENWPESTESPACDTASTMDSDSSGDGMAPANWEHELVVPGDLIAGPPDPVRGMVKAARRPWMPMTTAGTHHCSDASNGTTKRKSRADDRRGARGNARLLIVRGSAAFGRLRGLLGDQLPLYPGASF
jgi:hypothetical protein